MSDCCHEQPKPTTPTCCEKKQKPDYLLRITAGVIITAYVLFIIFDKTQLQIPYLHHFCEAVFSQVNSIWYGIVIGMVFVGLLEQIPRELIMKVLGQSGSFQGILRATLAGVFFDLCSHGILLIGGKLYERGASLGQVMAFLIASPWNSLSLTVILFTLIGVPWTLAFIAGSLLIAIISGVLFDRAVANGILEPSPYHFESGDFLFWEDVKKRWHTTHFDRTRINKIARDAVHGSRMVLRWLFLGLLLAALSRTLIPAEAFALYFGISLMGLLITLTAATVLEICSEGSVPLAADIFTRAHAPGNAFAFLMAGVSTDYTELMVLRQVTGSWKTALFLPLLTLPQIIALAIVMNHV